jgi:hypothetical protein
MLRNEAFSNLRPARLFMTCIWFVERGLGAWIPVSKRVLVPVGGESTVLGSELSEHNLPQVSFRAHCMVNGKFEVFIQGSISEAIAIDSA